MTPVVVPDPSVMPSSSTQGGSRTWKVDTFCRVKAPLATDPSGRRRDADAPPTFIDFDYISRASFDDRVSDSNPPESPNILRLNLPNESGPFLWNNRRTDLEFQFTEVFKPNVSQDYVYDRVCQDVVIQSMDGFNGTIFAYGQTGSGKTYTITGGENFHDRGLIPRAINHLYTEIKRRSSYNASNSGRQYRVLISYMEIYKECVYDLLDATSRNRPLEEWTKVQMMDDEDGEMHLRNLQLYEAATEEDALNLLFLGNYNRITSATPMNEASSRSHVVFTLRISCESIVNGRTVSTFMGKLNLVDLAGSERMYKTDRETLLKTRIEGRYINLSLHYLEQVIVSLQEKARVAGQQHVHIPYRNSVMTSILRDSLGGNCRTVFVVTLNSEVDHLEESISTCRFAHRCSQLSMDVLVNEEVDVEELAAKLEVEVTSLRARVQSHEKTLKTTQAQLRALEERNRPRSLRSNEKNNCRQMLHALLDSDDPEGACLDREWFYTTDRANLEECFRVLLRESIHTSRMAQQVTGEMRSWRDTLLRSLNSKDSLSELGTDSPDRHRFYSNNHHMEPPPAYAFHNNPSDAPISPVHPQRPTSTTTAPPPPPPPPPHVEPSILFEGHIGGSHEDVTGDSFVATIMSSSSSLIGMETYYYRLLTRGAPFLKQGRHGKKHARFVFLSGNLRVIMWRKFGESQVRTVVPMSAFHRVEPGCSYDYRPGEHDEARILTLFGAHRHLTLEMEDMSQGGEAGSRDEWVKALRYAIEVCHHHQKPPTEYSANVSEMDKAELPVNPPVNSNFTDDDDTTMSLGQPSAFPPYLPAANSNEVRHCLGDVESSLAQLRDELQRQQHQKEWAGPSAAEEAVPVAVPRPPPGRSPSGGFQRLARTLFFTKP